MNGWRRRHYDKYKNAKISGLFPNDLLINGESVTFEQKPREMTLEDIEEALGYPIKIVKEKE